MNRSCILKTKEGGELDMVEIFETEKVALKNAIKGIFEEASKNVIADLEATQRQGFGGEDIIKGLKKAVSADLWDKIEDTIKLGATERAEWKVREIISEKIRRILQIKGISLSDFNTLEQWEMEQILQES